MKLAALIDRPGAEYEPDLGDMTISGITADSRKVQPGYLFAALPGSQVDGRRFIKDALGLGAVAVLTTPDVTADQIGIIPPLPLIKDPEPRRRLAWMAARFFKAQPAMTVAVTGTNGKTSVASFAQQIWAACQTPAASMGTLGINGPGVDRPGALTTPDPITLHRDLAHIANAGIDHLALEASSHGLDQNRLDGIEIKAAGFTNLSRDHIDYHQTLDAYRDAKLRLFTELLPKGSPAVLNADSDAYDAFEEACRDRDHQVIPYGEHAGKGGLKVENIRAQSDGLSLSFSMKGVHYDTNLPLAGGFQAWNALCALGLVCATGTDEGEAVQALENLDGAPGRLQRVAVRRNDASIYVDYAHTPDALQTVLLALRPHTRAKLSLVFGCGGDRDRGKRPMMGEVAQRLADRTYVTDDNPRSEIPEAIRAEILPACPDAIEIGDRAEAIAVAIRDLKQGDLLVIAGKGHEQGQIIGDRTIPFDDAEVAREAVAQLGEAA